MRAVWVVTVILVAVGLVAWGTTCTGQRPIPTGDTIPSGAVATTTTAVADPGTEVLAG